VLGFLWKVARTLRHIDQEITGYKREHDAMWYSHAEFARIDPALYRPERKDRASA
jgi:hypothetical protein